MGKFIIIKKYLGFIIISVLGFLPLLDLFHPGLPLTHDGQDHVARIANFYQSLSEGNVVPRWAGNLNWSYGHPILMFLYPLPSYFASLFHLIGFSFVDSLKLVFGLGFILSGIFMYLWVRNFLGELAGLTAGVLYMIAPYRFVDLYVRGAIGEHMAFVFVPLILYFLLKLSKKYSYRYLFGGAFSFAALILSHNAISIMFLPFILFYGFYLIWSNSRKKELLFQFVSIFVIGFGLSAFFLLPAFFEGKYTLRDIVTKGEYASRFISVTDLFKTDWDYQGSPFLSKQIGIIHLASIILSIIFVAKFLKKDKKQKVFYWGIFIYFFVSIFIMLKESNFIWSTFSILQKFQFPWRFLSVTVFTSAVLSGFFVSLISKKYKLLLVISILFLVMYSNKDYWHAKDYLFKDQNFYTGIYNSTTDTGESSPIWSIRFMEKKPKNSIEVIDGQGKIEKRLRESTFHSYMIKADDKVRIRENTVYFPGWKVYIDGKNTDIEFQDQANRGLITFYLDKGIHEVIVKFEETKLRQVANIVSIVSLLLLLGYGLINTKIKKRFMILDL